MRFPAVVSVLLLGVVSASAQERITGPVIHSAGAVYEVERPDFPTPPGQMYAVAFEMAGSAASPEELNATLNSTARFLNMHARAGVPRDHVRAAVVVHGPAGWEVLDHAAYRSEFGVDNPNVALIQELRDAGVRVILCGQSAASRGIPRAGLIEGVEVALSAMTAFLVLQEQGYRVNPW